MADFVEFLRPFAAFASAADFEGLAAFPDLRLPPDADPDPRGAPAPPPEPMPSRHAIIADLSSLA